MTAPSVGSVRLTGRVVRPGDDEYAVASAGWNRLFTHAPSAVVFAVEVADVVNAVTFARHHDLPLRVRSGGHCLEGWSSVDGGVVIDVSGLKSVTIDAQSRTATVGAGLTQWEAVTHLGAAGLAAPTGTEGSVSLAGATLGGGFGLLTRRFGMACDSLLAAEVVVASQGLGADVVAVDGTEHADLLWALRGAGTNFGVVTELVLGLHEVDPMANLGFFFWRAEDAAEPLAFARDYLADLPARTGGLVVGLSAPPEPFVPAEHHGAPGIAVIVVGWGSAEAHAAAVGPLRGLGALFELVTPIPYVALQQMLDETGPWGIRAYDKGLNLDDLSDDAIEVILTWLPRRRSPMSFVPIFPLIGRYREIADDATAFGSSRSRRWAVSMVALAWDEESFAADRTWARSFWQALRPYAPDDSTYVNFDADSGQGDRVRASYGPEKYRRLAALKAEWDPDNVFHHNANIVPEPRPSGRAAGVPAPRVTAASETEERTRRV